MSRPVIEITDSSGTRRLELEGLVHLGRESGDVLIADAAVSGRHLRLEARGATVVATDLGSSNGTFRGTERLAGDVDLAPGDVLRLGATTIRLVEAPAPPPSAPASAPAHTPSTGPVPTAARSTAPSRAETLRTDAVEVRFVAGTYGASIAKGFAATVARSRRDLAGFGSEPWGTVPIINLIDPYLDGEEIVSSGSVVEASRGEAWVVVSPEAPAEPPHRALALIFGAALPGAASLQHVIEGFGLHLAGAPEAAEQLAELDLPAFEDATGELRAQMALSFVRFLVEREREEGVVRLLGAPAGNTDDAAREIYGLVLGQLEMQWRRKVASGEVDVKTGEFLRLSLRYLRPYRARQVEVFGYMLLSLAFVASFPFVTKRLFDRAIPSGEFSQVLTLLFVLGGAFVISLIAGVRQAYQTAWISGAVTRDIRQAIFDKVQLMPARWYSEHPQGDVLSRLFSDVGVVQNGLSQAIGQGVFQVVSLITTSVIMLTINFWLGLLVIAGAPCVAIVYRKMSGGAMTRSLTVQENSGALLSVAAESYRANPVVKMFGLSGREQRRFAQQGERLFRSTRRLSLWGGMFGLSVNLIVTTLRLVVLGIGAWLILEGEFTMGGLVAFLSIMGEVLSPVTVLVSLSQDVQESMGSLVRINEIVDAVDEEDTEQKPDLAPLRREVRLAGVGLSYTSERRALDDLDVTVEAGTRVAFVGPSGSGKSTVLRLLMRLYEPDEGAILVDGVDIRSGSLESWRRQLGVVFQDSFLFDATVRENIALGLPGATAEQIEAAAKAAEVDSFLHSLPRGWDTLVGEGGSNLSGGQRQRVAIARALIRNPRLLLLDEATSALDPATERQINDTIDRISTDRTVVSVTHRLASIANYDKIVVVVDGRLAEQGTHEQLLARRGAYARLWAEQMGTPMPEPEPIDLQAALRRVPFLVDAGDALLDAIEGELVPFRLEAGRSVAEGDGLMLVAAGRGEVLGPAAHGAEPPVVAELREGEAFGVSAALGAPPAASLRASEDMELLHLSARALASCAGHHPELAARLHGGAVLAPPRTATRLNRVTMARAVADAPERRLTRAVFAPPAGLPR